MRTFALALLIAAAGPDLTDPQKAELGGFVAERIDANPGAEELERAIVEKMDAIQKAGPGTTTTEAPKGKGKKKAGKKTAKKSSNTQNPETIKNGLNEADRTAFGRFIAGEIAADRKG